ncbi:protein IQ-DOMAIN 3-like [Nymphaea colorata]|nr:protein IQ-DOMAIN 3-like [Nymphaea colorata]XP_031497238.1 protein IQ-DOMAIN 3-like [Nymphaea colorata]XP_031497244.1 protein IQ-DOMAIN 3-like [Nymphaea colorata]XP_049936600.1 protein IQ-DOMAIN 3-like [Nymphaea colorata]
MGGKNNCFNLLKRKLFGSGADVKPKDNCGKKKDKEKGEWISGRLKTSCPPSIKGPKLLTPPTTVLGKTLTEAEEAQSKHAVAVAIATAAAAEAAVAAAQAAAQVVRLTGSSGSYHHLELSRRVSAAVRIQSAFRGYLARKALRALKGLVKLQALIRGHMVRRQAQNAFRSMQALQRIQSQACFRRVKLTEENKISEQKLKAQRRFEIDRSGQKRWDGSRLTKEQTEVMFLSRQEATFRRERAKEYYLDHRDKKVVQKPTTSASSIPRHSNNETVEWNWIEHWMDSQSYQRGSESSSASSFGQNPVSEKRITEAKAGLDTLFKEEIQSKFSARELQNKRRLIRSQSPTNNTRKSTQRTMIRDDESYASSTASLPSYMVYTESAKAKARSNSTPRQRTSTLTGDSDHKSINKNCSFASLRSDASSTKLKLNFSSHPRSPAMRGLPGPVKSDRTITSIKDLSLDSDCSFLNLDRQRVFR